MNPTYDFTGQVALITGASSGMGLATAHAFAEAGAAVVLTDVNQAALQDVTDTLTEAGHQCVWVKDGQRGLEEAVQECFDAIILDLLLPGMPGLSLLKKLRAQGVRNVYGLGLNTTAGLVTRGASELTRLALAMGIKTPGKPF